MSNIEKLINIFKDFPTVGKRTAGRFVYYLLKLPKERTDELIKAIEDLKKNVKLCQLCFNPFEDQETLCQICRSNTRNKSLLCIVEKETDLDSIENLKKYNGLYFILGGAVEAFVSENEQFGKNIRIEDLKSRISKNDFKEIIIALNPTPEGRTTSVFIEKEIKELGKNFKITHLARGLPVGGELEYADPETLQSAIEDRK